MPYDVNVLMNELSALRLPELRERYEREVGKPTRCPNRTFLIRSICGAVGSRSSEEPNEEADDAPASLSEPHSTASAALDPSGTRGPTRPGGERVRGRFSSMTTEELQVRYREVVGRDTGSDNKRYLIWKIREAEKGTIPVGPRPRAVRGRQASMRVLPLRLDGEAIAAIDRAWKAAGLRSRMTFLRGAIGLELKRLGADGASLFELG